MKGAKGKGAAKVSKEAAKPADDRKVGKRKAPAAKVDTWTAKREKKAKKDPNQPKKPPTAFFVFLGEFRKTFKKENPNVNSVAAVGKAAGQKWKSMTPAEKAPYESKAGKMKVEYGKQMDAYNKKQVEHQQDEDEDEEEEEDEDEDEDEDEEDDD